MNKTAELLAPAGNVEAYFAALESGADAIYLGLKRFSARATATNFSLEELASLLPYAHRRNAKVYAALNSLLTAPDIPGVLDTLQALADLKIDALIVQDAGLFHMVRKYFPEVKLHASTLMTVHNSAGVNQLQRMGAERIVLARELKLEEIDKIASSTRAELEIFVHGALCYSYSGLCLASSFRGGHSGLQGRCVQPCRLRFQQGRKEGYFLSCNDLCALPLLPELKKLRLAAFKIEGRMKSADYIARVVKAYRLVLDAPAGAEAEAIGEAQEQLAQAPSRRLTSGFLAGNFHAEVLTPHRSGSSGLWVGTVKAVREPGILVEVRHEIRPGDRIRPESHEGREEAAFTVSEVLAPDGKGIGSGAAGTRVLLKAPGQFRPQDRLFRIGSKSKPASALWQKVRKEVPESLSFRNRFARKPEALKELASGTGGPSGSERKLIIKIGLSHHLTAALQAGAQRVILSAGRSNLERLAKVRLAPAQKKDFFWSLPALMPEKELDYYRSAIAWYVGKGFLNWELNNWGHFDLLPERARLTLMAGCRFNVRNAAAMATLAEMGCRFAVLSLEITREELLQLGETPPAAVPVVVVHAWPPLFTSRLLPKLQEERPFTTPRREVHFFHKRGELSCIYADRPMNWFEAVPSLEAAGYRHFLIDMSEGPQDQAKDLELLLNGCRRSKPVGPHSLFNFERRP